MAEITDKHGRTAPMYSSENVSAITPHDSTNLTALPRAIYVGVTGDVVAVWQDDTTFTFKNVSAGTVLPIRPKRINSTNTTAASLGAFY